MTYSAFKTRLVRRLTTHKLSPVEIDEAFDSEWCVAVREHLNDFVIACEGLYVHLAPFAIAVDDQIIDLSTAVTGYAINTPLNVYVDGVEKERTSIEEISSESNQVSVSSGTPASWAKLELYRIMFDKPCSEAFTGNYVSGLADHPAIASDQAQIRIPTNDVPAAIDYISAQFAADVAGDELGLMIANRYQKRADLEMVKILARNRVSRIHFTHRGEG